MTITVRVAFEAMASGSPCCLFLIFRESGTRNQATRTCRASESEKTFESPTRIRMRRPGRSKMGSSRASWVWSDATEVLQKLQSSYHGQQGTGTEADGAKALGQASLTINLSSVATLVSGTRPNSP